MCGCGEFQKMVTKSRWWRKRRKSGTSITLQSFKVFAVLLCTRLFIMGYSWQCGRLLLRICLNDFHFVGYLQTGWFQKFSGVTGYMNSLGNFLDFRRGYSDLTKIHRSMFISLEIYIQRIKCFLSRKMKSDWRELLSVDYQNSINC